MPAFVSYRYFGSRDTVQDCHHWIWCWFQIQCGSVAGTEKWGEQAPEWTLWKIS